MDGLVGLGGKPESGTWYRTSATAGTSYGCATCTQKQNITREFELLSIFHANNFTKCNSTSSQFDSMNFAFYTGFLQYVANTTRENTYFV